MITLWLLSSQRGEPLWVTLKAEDPSPILLAPPPGGFRRSAVGAYMTIEQASDAAFKLAHAVGTRVQGSGPLHNPIRWTADGQAWVPVDTGAHLELAVQTKRELEWKPLDGKLPTAVPFDFKISQYLHEMILKANAPSPEQQAKLEARERRVRKAKAETTVKAAEFRQKSRIEPTPAPANPVAELETWRTSRRALRKKPQRKK